MTVGLNSPGHEETVGEASMARPYTEEEEQTTCAHITNSQTTHSLQIKQN